MIIVDILVVLFSLLFCFNQITKVFTDVKYINIAKWLLFYHLVIFIVSYQFTTADTSGDSMRFFSTATSLNWDQLIYLVINKGGTGFMFFLAKIFQTLGLTFFGSSFLFSSLGFVALLYGMKMTIDTVPFNSKIIGITVFPLIYFLPNLHFWASTFGKDTLSLLCIILIIYNWFYKRNLLVVILFTVILSALRPHVVLFLALAYIFTLLFNYNVKLYKKIALSIILLIPIILILPRLLELIKVSELSVDSLSGYAETSAGRLSASTTTSAIDVQNSSFFYKIFSFLFRPALFDINSLLSLVAAIENLILLILFMIAIVQNKIMSQIKNFSLRLQFMFYFSVIGVLIFGNTLGNLGIMLRMRNMFLPFIILIIMYLISQKKYGLLKN